MNTEKYRPVSKIAASITTESKRKTAFWRMYQKASLDGEVTKEMQRYGEVLLTKQDKGIQLFNSLMRTD